jgi:hypothetical protein
VRCRIEYALARALVGAQHAAPGADAWQDAAYAARLSGAAFPRVMPHASAKRRASRTFKWQDLAKNVCRAQRAVPLRNQLCAMAMQWDRT